MLARRARRLLEGNHLAGESVRQTDVEAACRGLRPTPGYYGRTIMMIMLLDS